MSKTDRTAASRPGAGSAERKRPVVGVADGDIKVATYYDAYWNLETHTGHLVLRFAGEGGGQEIFNVKDAAELQLMTDLLRSEFTVWYNASKKILFVENEPVGESE